jgi:Holliday junction resolvase RusA-like endonuclease
MTIKGITPVSKPRQTQADRWKKRPAVIRYRAFADELRLKYPHEMPLNVHLTFHMPMPKSWSKRKRAEMVGKPHQQKPDLDNLQKAVWDALLEEDSIVWRCVAEKYWGVEGSIEIKGNE